MCGVDGVVWMVWCVDKVMMMLFWGVGGGVVVCVVVCG